jgi:3-dehydro-L-gulonate 2-dehydrogenase
MKRVDYAEMVEQLTRVLCRQGFEIERAGACAKIFADNSRDGVYSHGLNRFPRFIEYIQKGYIAMDAQPELVQRFGTWERWDGHLGPGSLNAQFAMNRAIQQARENGMGCVALKNTNHWMRGGTYGWQAAEAECIGICWSNTTPNMPVWGGRERRLGNNPLVLAVPRAAGHIVLDMALSQFSMGKVEIYQRRHEMLPFDGGFDKEGKITRDPEAISETLLGLPIGYWKGSGLSFLLDLVATVLSSGNSTAEIGRLESEYALSQVFLAFDLSALPDPEAVRGTIMRLIDHIHQSEPLREGERIYYPGERTLQTRNENLEQGIPVDEAIWKQVLAM